MHYRTTKMKTELRTITPHWAKKTLDEKNIGNRPMNKKHVTALAAEILNGRWKINGDTICLNETRLIDGQHRLAAVVLADKPIQSFVVDGLPSDVFDTKDIGKRRGAGDVLSILGHKNARRLGAALAMVDKYVTGRVESSATYSNTEIEGLIEKYPDLAASIQTQLRGSSLLPLSVFDGCYYLFFQKDQQLANIFVEKISRGTGLEEGTAWYALRERLVVNSISKAKLTRPYLMALCIKAWNHARAGTNVKYLRWREKGDAPEPFPVIK